MCNFALSLAYLVYLDNLVNLALNNSMKVAILGYGNIGRAAEQAILAAPDMELAGIYHHNDNLDAMQADVVLLCTPTREVEGFAQKLLQQGICTVDSFDIHNQILGKTFRSCGWGNAPD